MRRFPLLLVASGLLALGCAGPPTGDVSAGSAAADARENTREDAPMPPSPHIRILGTAQDGGFPHVACQGPRCAAAHADPSLARRVASLAIVTEPGTVWLVDATPDLRPQLDAIARERAAPADATDRAPVDGVLLTHAHLGHYTGLAFFGFEATNTRDLPLVATPAMLDYLRTNGPWSQLFTKNNVAPHPLSDGESFALSDTVSVEPFQVPHRNEFADTVGWRIAGPDTTVLYIPDMDVWDGWDRPIDELLEDADVALIDGTFYSDGELPGRDTSKIPHPRIVDSMELLRPWIARGKRIVFTHFNHSNPLVLPDSPETTTVRDAGFEVAADGDVIGL